ncbi:hypothetical protein EDB83DRAFT_2310547 [Lactarius deliciosus]|nr:hypothetical protein EDB83DRAFT_2310547 [Lactarius deliciosus]
MTASDDNEYTGNDDDEDNHSHDNDNNEDKNHDDSSRDEDNCCHGGSGGGNGDDVMVIKRWCGLTKPLLQKPEREAKVVHWWNVGQRKTQRCWPDLEKGEEEETPHIPVIMAAVEEKGSHRLYVPSQADRRWRSIPNEKLSTYQLIERDSANKQGTTDVLLDNPIERYLECLAISVLTCNFLHWYQLVQPLKVGQS